MTREPIIPQNPGTLVLVCKEEMHEDRLNHSVEHSKCTDHVINDKSSIKQSDIVELYSTSNEQDKYACQPFIQKITFAGPSGEKVQIEVLFDKGAMISAMCTKTFK